MKMMLTLESVYLSHATGIFLSSYKVRSVSEPLLRFAPSYDEHSIWKSDAWTFHFRLAERFTGCRSVNQ